MAEVTTRDAKLIQYLNEAYGKERQLETALQAHIAMTTRDSYKKRLKDHLKETKAHAREVKARIKKLGGKAEEIDVPGPGVVTDVAASAQSAVRKGAALAQGPIHMLRGTSEQEKLLKNAKTEYAEEAEEIATYTAIEALAEAVGDRETAALAKRIRRDEERMASFLARLIPTLTRAVATEEIPAAERKTNGRARTSSRRASSRSASSNGRKTTASSARKTTASSARKTTASNGRKTTAASGRKTTSRAKARA